MQKVNLAEFVIKLSSSNQGNSGIEYNKICPMWVTQSLELGSRPGDCSRLFFNNQFVVSEGIHWKLPRGGGGLGAGSGLGQPQDRLRTTSGPAQDNLRTVLRLS